MAARTSTGVGVGVTVTILGVLSLGLFVTTVIFLSQKQAAVRASEKFRTDLAEFVSGSDKQDQVQQTKALALKGRMSVFGYLEDQREKTMERVTGAGGDRLEDLNEKLKALPGSETKAAVQLLREFNARLGTMQKELDEAKAARDRAQQDRENEVARVKAIEDSQKATLAALTQQLDTYKDEVDKYRAELNTAKADMDKRVDKIRQGGLDTEAQLNSQITDLQKEVVLSRDTISRLQNELHGRTFKPGDEHALVDGQVIGLDPAENQVIVNVGRRQRAVLGMTFEVYSEPTAIRPDPVTGDYPPGKAAIELIHLDDSTSTGRIIREKKGNPLVKGDVIANAVFDPKKVYKFLVYGNFDANGDGIATPEEKTDIQALIEQWGGKVTDTLSGDVDFLVLGQKPTLPPQPSVSAPPAVVQEFVRLKRIALEYDDLFNKAVATSIPILNENRLYTLTGKR